MDARYFSQLSSALAEDGSAYPTLVIDKKALDHNIDQVKKTFSKGLNYRIVAKSLPSLPLLKYIMDKTATGRLMSFHLPFLMHLIESNLDLDDILIGKPMPVAAVEQFYDWYTSRLLLGKAHSFQAENQLQWLIDTQARLEQYEHVAKTFNVCMRVNLEIDVGLHRGGFDDFDRFKFSLEYIKSSPHLQLSGLMGYEAHITKIPMLLGGPRLAEFKAKKRYKQFVDIVKSVFSDESAFSIDSLCLNAAGSTTYPLYSSEDSCNELSVASALVKPSDFDVYTLDSHRPAVFIAAPILKTVKNPELPMASGLSAIMRRTGVLPKQAAFIYGGNWLAKPCWPASSQKVEMFGHSSNQELYSLASTDELNVDDYMFFRPTQSEAVLLQFGEIAVYEGGAIKDRWPVFEYPKAHFENDKFKTVGVK